MKSPFTSRQPYCCSVASYVKLKETGVPLTSVEHSLLFGYVLKVHIKELL
jgi:hypothetical protein